jgi:fructose-bisphosphate aldolase, class II
MKNINECVTEAAAKKHIIPGFNVFGHEDALAVVRAAQRADSPVILMVNRDCRAVMDIAHWGALFSSIASRASVPVGVHLDHSTDKELIIRAMSSGFTSVMYDGSKLPIEQNIINTIEIVSHASKLNISVEGEVGFVPYDDKGEKLGDFTSPEEANRLHVESDLDWLAISVGNVHRLADSKVAIDFQRLFEIESVCSAPLVIHGASGIFEDDIQRLKSTRVGKVNIGTALRYVFGTSLRKEFDTNQSAFDRLSLFANPIKLVEEKAYELIILLTS